MNGGKCLECGALICSPAARGLCGRCYRAAYRRVRARQTTWADLIAAGKALAPQPSSLFGQRLRRYGGPKY